MDNLNYKHLHYFWVIAKSGGVAKAGERLHVTPQSISTQMRQLEFAVGGPLWRRAGRKLELTETGHLVLDYADRLFAIGEELKEALRDHPNANAAHSHFRVGIADAVPKTLACQLLAPVLKLPLAPELHCREGRLVDLLAALAIHQLDMVISDQPMNSSMNVRGYNHLLLECGVAFFATASISKRMRKNFPQSLDAAPMLMPSENAAMRQRLLRWFDTLRIMPRVIANFDDSALMKAFGQRGAGVFAIPSHLSRIVAEQFNVQLIGSTDQISEQIYAITGERRIKHPAASAISVAAYSLGRGDGRNAVDPPKGAV